jgi:hypothetical protein
MWKSCEKFLHFIIQISRIYIRGKNSKIERIPNFWSKKRRQNLSRKSHWSEGPRWAYSLNFLGFSKRLDYTPGTRFDRATCAVVRDEFRHWASSTSGAQNAVFCGCAPTFALLFLLLLLLLVLCCSLFRTFFLWSSQSLVEVFFSWFCW